MESDKAEAEYALRRVLETEEGEYNPAWLNLGEICLCEKRDCYYKF